MNALRIAAAVFLITAVGSCSPRSPTTPSNATGNQPAPTPTASTPPPPPDPARGAPLAWLQDHYIYPDDLGGKRLQSVVLGALFEEFVRERNIRATEAQIAKCEKKIGSMGDTSAADAETKAGIRTIAESMVKQWLIDKALYEQYGGPVIFQQMNPFEPVGAYRGLLEDHERRGTFKILDDSQREPFWSYFTREHPMQVPKDMIDFSKPWWESLPR